MEQNELYFMTEAYTKLYQIENHLRKIINQKLTTEYGKHWHAIMSRKVSNRIVRKDFSTLNFPELISYFNTLQPLSTIYSSQILHELQMLTPIRNKIAHNRLLTKDEFIQLDKVFRLLFILKVEMEVDKSLERI